MDMMTPPMTKRSYYLENNQKIADFNNIKFTILDEQGYGVVGVYNYLTKQVITQQVLTKQVLTKQESTDLKYVESYLQHLLLAKINHNKL